MLLTAKVHRTSSMNIKIRESSNLVWITWKHGSMVQVLLSWFGGHCNTLGPLVPTQHNFTPTSNLSYWHYDPSRTIFWWFLPAGLCCFLEHDDEFSDLWWPLQSVPSPIGKFWILWCRTSWMWSQQMSNDAHHNIHLHHLCNTSHFKGDESNTFWLVKKWTS